MPCFYQYKYYTERIKASQISFLSKAALRIEATLRNTSSGYTVMFASGSTASVVAQGSEYLVSSRDENSIGTLMQELVVAKLRAELELEGKSVERRDVKGEIELVVSE
tara:strand:- start:620 stop:943 length:324 start_codon:yes stop_codon:yes gene_type:complete